MLWMFARPHAWGSVPGEFLALALSIINNKPKSFAYLSESDVSKYVWQEDWRNPVYVRRVDSSILL